MRTFYLGKNDLYVTSIECISQTLLKSHFGRNFEKIFFFDFFSQKGPFLAKNEEKKKFLGKIFFIKIGFQTFF